MNAKVMKETASKSLIVSYFGTKHYYSQKSGVYTLTENFYPAMLRCTVLQESNVDIQIYVFRGETSLMIGRGISNIVWGRKFCNSNSQRLRSFHPVTWLIRNEVIA